MQVEDLDGRVLRSVPAAWYQAERIKGLLIAQLHESGRRDHAVVRIVDAHDEMW